jgi:hypothetical protein
MRAGLVDGAGDLMDELQQQPQRRMLPIAEVVGFAVQYVARGQYDLAVDLYRQAIRQLGDDQRAAMLPDLRLRCAEAFLAAYRDTGDAAALRSGQGEVRELCALLPFADDGLTVRLLFAAIRLHVLDEVLRRLQAAGMERERYEKCLAQARVMADMAVDAAIGGGTRRPRNIVMVMFDFVLLPVGLGMVLLSVLGSRWKGLLLPGLLVFGLYLLFRVGFLMPGKKRRRD